VLPFTPPDKDFDKVVYIIYDDDENRKRVFRHYLIKRQ
jgi:hypothetical protein